VLEPTLALLFMAGPCISRLWQVSRCSIVASTESFYIVSVFKHYNYILVRVVGLEPTSY
jgi:hypothetical protein